MLKRQSKPSRTDKDTVPRFLILNLSLIAHYNWKSHDYHIPLHEF